MENILIKVIPEEYADYDSAANLIRYIMSKHSPGGYGYPVPATIESITYSFHFIHESLFPGYGQRLWHFIISFNGKRSSNELLLLADQIAYIFAGNYQVIYGFDPDEGHYHLHFAVNAVSYHSGSIPLDDNIMIQYLHQINSILTGNYPSYKIKLLWEGGSDDV